MIDDILYRYRMERRLSDNDIKALLDADKKERHKVFELAREVRHEYFGDEIFLYGFVYFSTYCKNNCNFCFYRNSNKLPPRYRKSISEIADTSVRLAESGVHLIDLTMGEDPYYSEHFDELTEIIGEVKKQTGLPIMISPGVLSEKQIDEVSKAGADWYALYQETHSHDLFKRLRLGQDYDERMKCKKYASDDGMLIEEGLLTGTGDTVDDRIWSFRVMGTMGLSQVRTMTFVSQKGTPMESTAENDENDELLNIAVMRLIFPDRLIPASLDIDGLRGLKARLMAGANVVTSIIPPNKGFAGVAQSEHDIDDGNRTVEGIRDTISECGLKISTTERYKKWVRMRKQDETFSFRM